MIWRIVIGIVIVLLLFLIACMFKSRQDQKAPDSVPEAFKEPAQDDQDYIFLKKALTDGGVDYDIKLIVDLPDEGEYAKIFSVVVPGKKAVEIWKQLRSLVTSTRRWPLIMGSTDILHSDQFAFIEEAEMSVKEILEKAECIDLEKWMDVTTSSGENRYGFPSGEWPEAEEEKTESWELSISTHKDIETDRPHDSVVIGLLPVSEGWQAPAALKWGNWNECPAPEVHCAALKRWRDKYGAELIGITEDVLELKVDRLPADRDEAMALARFQYVYCPDSVEQGLGSVEALAAHILAHRAWFFWWD